MRVGYPGPPVPVYLCAHLCAHPDAGQLSGRLPSEGPRNRGGWAVPTAQTGGLTQRVRRGRGTPGSPTLRLVTYSSRQMDPKSGHALDRLDVTFISASSGSPLGFAHILQEAAWTCVDLKDKQHLRGGGDRASAWGGR